MRSDKMRTLPDLAALLEELAVIDQQTYNAISKTIHHYEISPDLNAPIIQDHIQGCVQRACFEKNWYITLEILPFETIENRKWRALITQYDGTTTRYDMLFNTTSSALLSAYLKAMRVKQKEIADD